MGPRYRKDYVGADRRRGASSESLVTVLRVARLMTTSEVAADFAVSEEWVRDHQAELGAIKLGDGPKARLRFEPERIDAYKARCRIEPPELARALRQRRRRHRVPAHVELIPIP
jgi:hypothetical protein